jgi:hypothetical protein
MKRAVKALIRYVATRSIVRRAVGNLIYPAIIEYLGYEVRPDVASPSGVVEQLAWKVHSHLVVAEEFRPTGQDCAPDGMPCNAETRARVLEAIRPHVSAVDGDILEFGVHEGASVVAFARDYPQRRVYGFDSFEGLPADWWLRPKGTFATEPPRIDSPNVTLVTGYFDKVLPAFLDRWDGRVALVHVDCVLYQSTIECLGPIIPRCQVGTVILFDEYYNYPGFEQHEWLAWRTTRLKYGIVAPCIAYDARRAAFKITDLGRNQGAGLAR